MTDNHKTKKQLIQELTELREQIDNLNEQSHQSNKSPARLETEIAARKQKQILQVFWRQQAGPDTIRRVFNVFQNLALDLMLDLLQGLATILQSKILEKHGETVKRLLVP